MAFKNKVDLHMHTDNSEDGSHAATLMCEYALRAGLRAIAITDHCECNRYVEGRYDRSIRQSYFEARKARAVFSGKLVVLAGLELGQATQDKEAAQKALEANSYDFVLGSLHNVQGEPDFWEVDYQKADYLELLDRYFTELYELAQWGCFDSLAHITYPLRYIVGEHHLPVDLARWSDQIDTILKELAEQGKALELNTSGLRQAYGHILPSLDILKRFRELGGEYITIGSDAHCCSDVGANIEDAILVAREAGFRHVTLFQQRLPVQIPME